MRLRRGRTTERDDIDARPGPESPVDLARVRRRMRRHNRRILAVEERTAALESSTEAGRQAAARLAALEDRVDQKFAIVDGVLDHLHTVPASHTGALRLHNGGRTVMGYADATPLDADQAYVVFEGQFRGTREVIQERQRAYLPLIVGRSPVLDLGCGRGEFLELLREADVAASGVDLDAGMVAEANRLGLEASVGDLFDVLAETPAGSVGAVVSFQVAEHLPTGQLDRVLREAHRVLTDDGLVVLETVNPHSLRASRFFWLDITHVIPLFPESLLSLARGCGFPAGVAWFAESSGDLSSDLSECGDYALVCAKSRGPLADAGLLEA